MGAGFVNVVIKVLPQNGGDEDAVLVRVYTAMSSLLREDMNSLVPFMRLAAAGGMGAEVLAEFNNGVVYRFTPGEMILPEIHPHDQHIQT